MDLSAFSTADGLVPLGAGALHWRPGLGGARHGEVFACSREATGGAAALALALDRLPHATAGGGQVLWVQDAAALRLTGRPYRPGLPAGVRGKLIHVVARKPEDVLFALEEGVRCRDLVCVIGEIAGNPKALDFTASRRLTLAAERHGVPLMLVRLDASRDLSSARMRWEVSAAPSPAPRWNPAAPGAPAWRAELFRARGHTPGQWILTHDEHGLGAATPPSFPARDGDLAGPAGDRSLAAG